MAIIMELVSCWSPSFPQDLFPVPILCWVSLGIQINFFFKSTLLLNWTYTKWPGYIIWTAFEGCSPYTTTAPKIKRMHSKFEQETAQSEGCRVTDALPLHISPSGCLFFGCCCFFCVFRNWFVWDESCSATRSHCTMLCMSPLIRINSRLVSSSNFRRSNLGERQFVTSVKDDLKSYMSSGVSSVIGVLKDISAAMDKLLPDNTSTGAISYKVSIKLTSSLCFA